MHTAQCGVPKVSNAGFLIGRATSPGSLQRRLVLGASDGRRGANSDRQPNIAHDRLQPSTQPWWSVHLMPGRIVPVASITSDNPQEYRAISQHDVRHTSCSPISLLGSRELAAMRLLATRNDRGAPNTAHILSAGGRDADDTSPLHRLFDDDTISHVIGDGGSTLDGALAAVLRFSVRWLTPQPSEATVAAPTVRASWQDVHCGDTTSLIRRRLDAGIGNQHSGASSLPLSWPSSGELDWARRNSALIYLLRTGQWQPVPSTPQEAWTERLATEFSGITASEARKILVAAFDAAPEPHQTPLPQPLSPDERGSIRANGSVVQDLHSGQLRGIPTKPSRPWTAALQCAVGGTGTEIAAILNIILSIIDRTRAAMITAG